MQFIARINKQAFFNHAKLILLSAILVTIVFSRLNLNSICIILLSAAWLFEGDIRNKLNALRKDTFFMAFSLYFILQVLGMFIGSDIKAGWSHVESQVGFFVIPLILCSAPVSIEMRKKIMMVFALSLTVALLFCMIALAWNNSNNLNRDLFFYHSLVSPIEHHAIYFSVYIFISILFLIYEKVPGSGIKQKVLYITWVGFLALMLVLLSSKLILSILLMFLIYHAFRFSIKKKRLWPSIMIVAIVISSITLLMSTNNPVKRRFQDVLQSNMDLLKKEKFDSNTAFTGFNLRLIFWRFTDEILDEQNAYLIGVGPANVQTYLNQKYISMDMYQGNGKGDTGFLGYNTHNQFLQSALGSGVIGLAVLIFWIIVLLKATFKKEDPVLWGITLTILLFFFIESVFNRQYGMILSTLIPLLYVKDLKKQKATHIPS